MPILPKFTRGNLPFWMTATVMAVFLIVFLIAPVAPPSAQMVTAEFIKQYELESSYDQRLGFLAAVITISILSAMAFFLNRQQLPLKTGENTAPSIGLLTCIVATVIFLAVYSRLVQSWMVTGATVASIGILVFTILAPFIHRRAVESIALLLTGAYVFLVVVPGFIIRPTFWPVSDGSSIAQIELHINSLVQPGTLLATGQNFFSDIPFGYGVFMPSIMSVLERRYGSFTVGGHVAFVQWSQVAFVILGALAYRFFRPRNYVGILVALMLAAPYWATTGLGIWHPNQTGFRSLPLPLGILTIAFAARLPLNWAAAYLGSVAMICLLINMETAVAVGVGMVVYLVLRTRTVPIKALLWMGASAAATLLLYLIVYRFALGRLPFATDPRSILTTFLTHVSGGVGLRLFNEGYWKESYYLVPLALVMFAHASYVVIASFQKLGDRILSHREAMKAAIATILIVWFAYYINFPNWWQIWTHLFLYGFLIIDLFDLRLFAIGRAVRLSSAPSVPGRRFQLRLTNLIPILLLLLALFHTNSVLAYFTRQFMSPDWTGSRGQFETTTVSGVLVPRAAGEALLAKSKYLQHLNEQSPGKVTYLTYNIEFVPMLTHIFQPIPLRNLWSYIQTDAGLDPAISKVFESKPTSILIDAPTGPLAVDGARKDFQERVRASVARSYHLAETTAGWQVWRPNQP